MNNEDLYINNENLVYAFASKYKLLYDEDMMQNLRMAMWRAITKYDANKGFALSTFIYTSLYNEYMYSFRDKYRKFNFVDNEVEDENNKQTSIFDFIEDTRNCNIEEKIDREHMIRIIYDYLETIEPKYKDMYIDYYFNSVKQRALSKKYDLSQGQISRKLKNINKCLQELLKDFK